MLHQPPTQAAEALARVVAVLSEDIRARRLLTARRLEAVMAEAFGASAASGAFDWRAAYDALEAAAAHALVLSPTSQPTDSFALLERLIGEERKRPTQTKRSEEQIRLQQFSTPLPYAQIAAVAAALDPRDVVLEPSAGTGCLAAFAKRAGARLIVNELDERRRALLEIVVSQRASGFDAAQIDDFLPQGCFPSVVLMNPPFSSSFDRAQDRDMAGRHLLAALKRLSIGGRLVAIMPENFGPERRATYWKALSERAAVRLRLRVDGSVYRKQGTGVDTALIVADKIPDAEGDAGCVHAEAADLFEALTLVAALPERQGIPLRAIVNTPTPRKTPVKAEHRKPVPAKRPAALAPSAPQPLAYEALETARLNEALSDIYASYRPQRVAIAGAQPHPTPLVESLAMASVAPPVPTQRPNVPPALIEGGALSEAQLETLIYAKEAHERFLAGDWRVSDDFASVELAHESDADPRRFRAGFFLGDGTGCGKGRQVAGVILDNWLSGRRRALWVSKNASLLEDAKRDWIDVGGSPTDIKPLSRWKADEAIDAPSGVLFATYATLRSQAKDGSTRLQQVIDWLSADRPEAGAEDDDAWGPVIAFDEAHGMGNAAGGEEGMRGKKAASQQGLAGLRLQNALPEARVVYVSATGATTVENLAYASRLGLWGGLPEYPFPSRQAFLSAMHQGGVAAMEVVARDLKAMGAYLARSLSFEGVEYELLESPLTERQREVYDAWTEGFSVIHTNLSRALQATNVLSIDGQANNAMRRSAVMSRFEGLKQIFFNHLLTGMKVSRMIASIREDLSAGHAVVIQLVSTGEAILKRRLETLSEIEKRDLCIDLSPRENCLFYLQEAFPVELQRVVEDENGNVTTETVRDQETGAPVLSREAVEMRDALIEKLALLDSVPTALDQIIWAFGPDAVAEVTGRSQRPVYRGEGESRRLTIEKRSASAGAAETEAFMGDQKTILVFSEAGGTGRSYHAALSARNQRRRIHYLLEPGWRADSAVQGLGRSHRSAQASAPLFRVMATDVQGEKRFTATIARRLDTLGALTKGQRQTGGQGLFRAEDNLESPLAQAALRTFYQQILMGTAESVSLERFEELTGLKLTASDGAILQDLPPMARFLNRILALKVDAQNAIFEEFGALIAQRTEEAAEAGTLDVGVETIRAARLTVLDRTVVYTDPRGGAETELVTLERADPVVKVDAKTALADLPTNAALLFHRKTGEPTIRRAARSEVLEDGTTRKRIRLIDPQRERYMALDAFDPRDWEETDPIAFAKAWDAAMAEAPDLAVSRFHLLTGLLLPIWKHLPTAEQRIWRAQPDDGPAILGRALSEADAAGLKAALAPIAITDAASVLAALLDEGRRLTLAEGATLALRRVGADNRIEIENAPATLVPALKAAGCFTEIIAWRARVFVPFDPNERAASEAALEKALAVLPTSAKSAAIAA